MKSIENWARQWAGLGNHSLEMASFFPETSLLHVINGNRIRGSIEQRNLSALSVRRARALTGMRRVIVRLALICSVDSFDRWKSSVTNSRQHRRHLSTLTRQRCDWFSKDLRWGEEVGRVHVDLIEGRTRNEFSPCKSLDNRREPNENDRVTDNNL